ncbi:MAG: flagellar motor protein MotB [Kineosporiaceae bacterium]
MSGGGHGAGTRRAHEEEHEEHENHERWLVSYADMMTLLMVLFIVMFAISQVDQKKFMALKTGLSAGFGAPVAILSGGDQLLDPGGAVAPDSVNLAGSAKGDTRTANENPQVSPEKVAEIVRATSHAAAAKEAANLKQAQEELKRALREAGLPKGATFRIDERGLVVTIATDQVLFDSGSAALRWKGKLILDALTPTLTRLPNKISVDGHTDSIPIHTARYPTNWELSTDRATGVLRYLGSSIPVARMSATGFADTRPLRAGTGASAMAANRRVEIVVQASVDNTAGRAIAEVANQVAHPSTPLASTPRTTPSPSPSAVPRVAPGITVTVKAGAKASTKPSAKAAAKTGATTTSGH